MQTRAVAGVAVLVVSVVAAATLLAFASNDLLVPPSPPQHGFSLAAHPDNQGNASENITGSGVWVAEVQSSANEPFSSYTVGLWRDGEVLVPTGPLHTGLLGRSGDLAFEFFDYGAMCLPAPCPPPVGPDGLLNENDYFRLMITEPGHQYVIRVFWAATGEFAAGVTIAT